MGGRHANQKGRGSGTASHSFKGGDLKEVGAEAASHQRASQPRPWPAGPPRPSPGGLGQVGQNYFQDTARTSFAFLTVSALAPRAALAVLGATPGHTPAAVNSVSDEAGKRTNFIKKLPPDPANTVRRQHRKFARKCVCGGRGDGCLRLGDHVTKLPLPLPPQSAALLARMTGKPEDIGSFHPQR